MEAKDIMNIIDEADCNPMACFIASDGSYRALGWITNLIEISFKVGYNQALKDILSKEKGGMYVKAELG